MNILHLIILITQQYPFKRETAEISYITSSWDFHTKYKGE